MATDIATVADIIAEMRGDGHTGPADALEWVRIKLEHYADCLDAAHKRELDAKDSVIQALRAELRQAQEKREITIAAQKAKAAAEGYADGKSDATSYNATVPSVPSVPSDTAKLREALAPFPSLCDWLVVNASKLGIPDMVAKLRERGDKARAALAATSSVVPSVSEVPSVPSDTAKLREALKHIKDRLPHMLQYMRVHWEDASAGGYFDELMLVIDATLAAPPRNCDVGTAEEQSARMRAFCVKNGLCRDGAYRCENCGLLHEFRCELTWAQLPYIEKEGGAK